MTTESAEAREAGQIPGEVAEAVATRIATEKHHLQDADKMHSEATAEATS